ncbi:hypothetical protein GALL_380380 [mine drainage metagenome]|uniref:Uncharacterized protein n=1 Tax=mine drainage metagenome TaxID=410659 RepID=A0A1J5QJR1_9ZZZZ
MAIEFPFKVRRRFEREVNFPTNHRRRTARKAGAVDDADLIAVRGAISDHWTGCGLTRRLPVFVEDLQQ